MTLVCQVSNFSIKICACVLAGASFRLSQVYLTHCCYSDDYVHGPWGSRVGVVPK